jgi:hypothetical protein
MIVGFPPTLFFGLVLQAGERDAYANAMGTIPPFKEVKWRRGENLKSEEVLMY